MNKDFILMTLLWTTYLVLTEWIILKMNLSIFQLDWMWSFIINAIRVIIGFLVVEYIDSNYLSQISFNGKRGRR